MHTLASKHVICLQADKCGADGQIRTDDKRVEAFRFTIKLHPQIWAVDLLDILRIIILNKVT